MKKQRDENMKCSVFTNPLTVGSAIKLANVDKPDDFLSEKQLQNLTRLSEIALGLIAVAGIVSVALIAPNLLTVVDKLFLKKGRHASKRQKEIKTAQVFYYLKKSGFIKFRTDKKGIKVFLTGLGKKRLERININACCVKKPEQWDKKWWLVAADIPTKDYRQAADLFRKKVKQMGFCPLQRTLWIYPHNPAKEVEYIANYYLIGRFITVMEISRMDMQDEEKITSYFKKIKLI